MAARTRAEPICCQESRASSRSPTGVQESKALNCPLLPFQATSRELGGKYSSLDMNLLGHELTLPCLCKVSTSATRLLHRGPSSNLFHLVLLIPILEVKTFIRIGGCEYTIYFYLSQGKTA